MPKEKAELSENPMDADCLQNTEKVCLASRKLAKLLAKARVQIILNSGSPASTALRLWLYRNNYTALKVAIYLDSDISHKVNFSSVLVTKIHLNTVFNRMKYIIIKQMGRHHKMSPA